MLETWLPIAAAWVLAHTTRTVYQARDLPVGSAALLVEFGSNDAGELDSEAVP